MLMPRSQQTTKVAPKQSPAPVGSTSSTAIGATWVAPFRSKWLAPLAPRLTTTRPTPRLRSAAIACFSLFAPVRKRSSGPLGRTMSEASMTKSTNAARSEPRGSSLRLFGSKETVPPRAFTRSIAVRMTDVTCGENSDVPMT